MSKQIIELPVDQLQLGHFVSNLDRPWADTPFLFQGFVVASDEDLQILKSLCKVVYVEVPIEEAEQSKLAASRKSVTASRPTEPLEQLAKNPAALVESVPVKDSIPLKTELALAATTYNEAKRSVGVIFDNLRRGGGLDVPHLELVVGSMVDSVFRNRDAMTWLARLKSKDDYLYSHSLSASVWALAFGRHLGLDKETLRSIGTGAMLLDIGKTQLPNELLKKADKPTPDDWPIIQSHVDRGTKLLRSASAVDDHVLMMIQTHHERLDGSGYPKHLKGDQIALIGRIAGVVDSYDAMISHRTYAKAMSAYDAVRELKRLGDSTFSTELVELFIQAVGVFPTGTLVELNTGEVGVVTAQNRYRRLRPEVMLILDAKKKVREEFLTVDLLTCDGNAGRSDPAVWISHGLERGAFGIDPTEYFL